MYKTNTYNLSGEYGIGYLKNGEKFYFDLEDYDKIKDYYWMNGSKGYIVSSRRNGEYVFLHKIIYAVSMDKEVDHIDRNKKDCRKCNLREATSQNNACNRNKRIDNTTGIIGVTLHNSGLYQARINIDKQRKSLGYYDNKEDAIQARLKAEKKYYKEFAPQRDLFKKYGIE